MSEKSVTTKKPKILLLSDDIFTTSGIGTMARTFVYGTIDRFDWVQLAAAMKHNAAGKIINASEAISKETGVPDAHLIQYPNDGYGDAKTLRRIILQERPDAILHFTDPRYWDWLYQIEHEIRNDFKIPIMYYAIWDNLPYPMWNAGAYASCDLIMGISKQSHLIHNEVLKYAGIRTHDIKDADLKDYTPGDVLLSYVPHGIDSEIYRPLPDKLKLRESYPQLKDAEFVVFWTNRNIRRKSPADMIHAFKIFTDSLPENKRDKVALLMHTNPVDPAGTDLYEVQRIIAPNCNIVFSTEKISVQRMNEYYNIADVTVNIASNEGFGLSSAESIMAGTCVLNNVTGGLQDQMQFIDANTGKWFEPTTKCPSNHRKTHTYHGRWAFPVWPSNISIQGSLATPSIFDDRPEAVEVAKILKTIYETPREERDARGLEGRKWLIETANMSASAMSNGIADSIMTLLRNWPGGNRLKLYKIEEETPITESGLTY